MATINGTPASETINGTSDADTINGLGGDDLIDGLAGDDILDGGEGMDMLYGGLGDDQLYAGAGGATLKGEDGNDTLTGSSVRDEIYDGAGDDVVKAGAGNDLINSNAYFDRFQNWIHSSGSDILDGEDGNDTIYVGRDASAGPSSDSVTLRGGAGNDLLQVASSGDTFSYFMEGGAGSDDLHLTSLSGDSSFTVDAGDDADTVRLHEFLSSASITLGGGSDTLIFHVRSYYKFYEGASIEVTDFQTGAGGDRVEMRELLIHALPTWDQRFNPFGGGFLRLVQSGADTLLQIDRDGRASGKAFETLITFRNTDATSFSENLGTYPADVSIHGTPGNDNIVGTGAAEDIYGYAGDDVIDGRAGADLLAGGPGNDIYILETAGDRAVEYADEGIDEVRTSVLSTYYLPANVERLTGTASAGQSFGGNELNNIIRGGPGNDTISGAAGDDWLIGGAGADLLTGEQGSDVYVVDGGDTVQETPQSNASGWDTVLATESYTLTWDARVEVLGTLDPLATTPINLTGNTNFQNLIYGNEGNNILIGGKLGEHGPEDHLNGGGGDDIYFVKPADLVFEQAGKGHDTVIVFSSTGYGTFALYPGSHVEVFGTINASGTEPYHLAGNAFQNLIYGNEGNNVLTSGGGGDHLNGGGGHDIYFVTAGDLVFEQAGKGHDTVNSNSHYTLYPGSHVEVLGTVDAWATTAINLTGNAFQNLIYGNEGNNVLASGGGGDHLNGGGGHDIYFVTAGDLVFEQADKGHDTVNSNSHYTLYPGSHVEVLGTVDASATTAINLTGNELHNLIYGNDGANVLTGGGGGDHLHGGGGNDILVAGAGADLMVGGAGGDTFQFQNLDSAFDVIHDFTSGADKIDLSQIDANSFLSGEGSFTFIGGNAFSGTAGELRVLVDGTTAHVMGDVNGDRVTDIHITILNAPPLTSSDFIL
ncbi:MAG TPA: calcium-binding protein [Allosphingosinicella sp.]|jgi:Ca2+-binding RTX toxin-like protein